MKKERLEDQRIFELPKRRILDCSKTRHLIGIPIPFNEITFFDVLDFKYGDKRLISGRGGFHVENDKIVTGDSITTESVPIGNLDSIFLREYKRVSDFVYKKIYELEIPFGNEHYFGMLKDIQWRIKGEETEGGN